jgi:hypothetical protein
LDHDLPWMNCNRLFEVEVVRNWLTIALAILTSGTLVWSGELPGNDDRVASHRIAQSLMQQPAAREQNRTRQQPSPEPLPETRPRQIPTPQPRSNASARASDRPRGQALTTGTFTGIVTREADGFRLKVSQTTAYKLDNQQEVQSYVGRRVRVTGTLDPSVNLIRVDHIEPLS